MLLNWKTAVIVFGACPALLVGWFLPDSPVLGFWAAALGIIPLACLLGLSTEGIAHRTNASIGGMLNASLANGTELIIGFFALRSGQIELLKASITGSLITKVPPLVSRIGDISIVEAVDFLKKIASQSDSLDAT